MRPGLRAHRVQRKTKWASGIFVTESGWICRGKGLKAGLRGIRIGTRRPDDINVDDIDGVNDSIALSLKKLKQLTASVFPTQARRWATIKFGQNLITEHSVMNQIYTGKSDALGARTTIGVTNTFEQLRVRDLLQRRGPQQHRILPTSVPDVAGRGPSGRAEVFERLGARDLPRGVHEPVRAHEAGESFAQLRRRAHGHQRVMFAAMFGARTHFVPDYWWKYVAHDFSPHEERVPRLRRPAR
jgi:hypothetical protein